MARRQASFSLFALLCCCRRGRIRQKSKTGEILEEEAQNLFQRLFRSSSPLLFTVFLSLCLTQRHRRTEQRNGMVEIVLYQFSHGPSSYMLSFECSQHPCQLVLLNISRWGLRLPWACSTLSCSLQQNSPAQAAVKHANVSARQHPERKRVCERERKRVRQRVLGGLK